MVQYTFKIVNALLYTIRPSATIGACILALSAYQPTEFDDPLIIPLLFAAFFGGAFCFLMNDLFDRKKDLLNNKRRPLATGEISVGMARSVSLFFAIVFLISTWNLGIEPFILSFGFLAISSTYSHINAKTGLLANVVVALMVSGTQWGVAVIKPDGYLIGSSVFLFFLTIPREVLLDWLDIAGDRLAGKKSFPMGHSDRSVKWLTLICLFVCSFTIYLTFSSSLNARIFISLAIVSAWLSFIPFLKKPNDKHALKSVRLTHLSFAFLILALFSR